MKIFSGFSNTKLAEKVSRALEVPYFLPEKFVFPDREERIRITEGVAGENTIVIQPLSTPVNENIIETCFLIDALKRSGADSVTLIAPYLGYQRQDHVFREGEAVSLEAVIKMLEVCGMDRIIVFDLHSVRIAELFKVPVVHLSALSLFADKIKSLDLADNCLLVSPDRGGLRRVEELSRLLNGAGFACIEKNRDLATGGVEVKDIKIGSGVDLKEKEVFIVDDMISGGGTIVKAVEFLKKRGVGEIFVFATHPVFSQNAPLLLQNLPIEKVYVTDSISVSKNKQFPKLEVLSIAGMLAEEIKRIENKP
ncbi:MAG: ribose-phosphate pyrophosphokinase [Patescibacteria group bacterium]|nr:ribose-phosphate pyrophosphokinase [Patescibacteria group bacterium]